MCPPSFKQKGIGIKIPIPKNPNYFFCFLLFPFKKQSANEGNPNRKGENVCLNLVIN